MESAHKAFLRRQKQVERKHRRLAEGYVTRMNSNGLFEHKPARRGRRWPLKLGLFLIVLGLGAKVGLVSALGTEAYAAHVEALETGNATERAGAFLMQIDPLTARAAEMLQTVF